MQIELMIYLILLMLTSWIATRIHADTTRIQTAIGALYAQRGGQFSIPKAPSRTLLGTPDGDREFSDAADAFFSAIKELPIYK